MRNLYYVAIEGTIGVGKTSLANLLCEKLGAKLVLESFEDNPFLSDFYDDPERHAFQTQLWFLLQRYQQQQELRQIDMFQNLVITDYMFVKDRLFASLNLSEKEMSLYDTVANMMEKNVIHPDLVIFLQADTETLMKNILGAFSIASELGVTLEKFNEYISCFNIPTGRGQIINRDRYLVIDDTYNSNYTSTVSGIESLNSNSYKGMRKILVLGDMLELGKNKEKFHKNLLEHTISNKIDIVFMFLVQKNKIIKIPNSNKCN